MFREVALETVDALEGGSLAVLAGDDGRRGELDLNLLRSPLGYNENINMIAQVPLFQQMFRLI